MRRIILGLGCFLCLLSCEKKPNVVFYNANVVDVEKGEIVPGMTVSVKDGRIMKIAKASSQIKEGERDLTGLYLMPGLIDSHAHLGNCGGMGWLEDAVKSYLKEGVTTVRDAGGDMRPVKDYKAQLDSGTIVGPDVYFSSFWAGTSYFFRRPRMDTKGYPTENAPWNQCISDTATLEDLEKMVIEAKEYGCTGLKLYSGLSFEMLQKIVPLCHKHGLKAWGHAETRLADAMEVVKAGVETVSHIYLIAGFKNSYSSEYRKRCFEPEEVAHRDSIYKEMIARGTILDATITVSSSMKFLYRMVNEAYRAGVKIDAGTDVIHRNTIFHKELNLLADSCGMSIPDVLRAATVVGAEVIGQEGNLGVIREGAEADLLILRSNPLESLAALQQREALYIDGKEVK